MIHIRIGVREDKCRSVYGILYSEEGKLDGASAMDAASFWCGILDGNANIRAHTSNEVIARYRSRVLEPDAEYREVCNVKLEPVGNLSYYEMAKKITTYLQKGHNKTSSPEKVLTGFPKFMATMSISPVHILGCENDYGLAPETPESAPDLRAALRSIQGSCPWAF
ncbi:hypothetical protein H7F10_06945 [Acidithiobacillus sp. HP-6]|uniref:hypothetical protein n=1 Tax=unclassified Acidithiobacillus TaxID=2614800 RepID=UPI00187ABF87|nr:MULTISPECIES: hypothetical protein [unclassified Acidithiobacillus]MBE7562691.1 hypothetical protein [Acidithiobacillus sp. HP-6]MBE7570513.1 hypothetical protein [Acidithiobacillus sp. HP-2]